MAYAAVISLKQTIHHLLNSSHTSNFLSPNRETLEIAHKQLASLQEALKKSDDHSNSSRNRTKLEAFLDRQIRETVHKLQDLFESHASDQFLEEISSPSLPLELDFEEIWQEITSLAEAAKEMEKHYIQELQNPSLQQQGDVAAATAADDDDDGGGVKMVGLSDAFAGLKDHVLIRVIRPDDFGVFTIFGGAGNGRSVVAKSVYDDICGSFDCGAWVRIGSNFQLKQVLQSIISQINYGNIDHDEFEGEEKMGEYVYKSLEGRRYIVALDDLRDTDIVIELRKWFPEQNNGSLVFLTTSFKEVAEFEERFSCIEIPVIWDESMSWSYIRLLIEGRGWLLTPEFEEPGRKIARNCRGFRLVLARIMVELLRSENNLNIWTALAAAEDHFVYIVDDEISEVPTITFLPTLYVCVFF